MKCLLKFIVITVHNDSNIRRKFIKTDDFVMYSAIVGIISCHYQLPEVEFKLHSAFHADEREVAEQGGIGYYV